MVLIDYDSHSQFSSSLTHGAVIRKVTIHKDNLTNADLEGVRGFEISGSGVANTIHNLLSMMVQIVLQRNC